MAYYDALAAKWATLTTGTTDQKIAAINAGMVNGPAQPVPIKAIVAYLRTQGAWLGIKSAAAGGNVAAEAIVDLNADLRMETVDMALPIVVQTLAAMVRASLITQAQSDAITALGVVQVPWCTAPVTQGGGGLSSHINEHDLVMAGLIAEGA